MKDMIEKIKEMFLQKDKMLVLALMGILIFVVCLPVKDHKETVRGEKIEEANNTYANWTGEQYKRECERELEQLLENMDGVGKVQVMLTLRSSGEKILAKDNPNSTSLTNEEDAEGGKRTIEEKNTEETTIYGRNNSGEEMPYVVRELRPEVEGVFIVADGGGEDSVCLQITEAVQALFDIEAHKIKIAKRKI